MTQRYFQMRHLITFEETNLVGNTYYTNYFSWQGRCRELFLRDLAPSVLTEIESGALRLVTAHASCDFMDEFRAFDEVLIRMKLLRFIPFGVGLGFEYSRADTDGAGEVFARGRQDIKFLSRRQGQWELCEIPKVLLDAIRPYESR